MSVLGGEVLYADTSEIPTLDLMVKGITKTPHFSSLYEWLQSHDDGFFADNVTRIRNFASYVAHEETIMANYQLEANDSKESDDGFIGTPDQKFLCITKRSAGRLLEHTTGIWTACMSKSPGFRERAIAQMA